MIHFFALTSGGNIFHSFKRYLQYTFQLELTPLQINTVFNESTFIFEFNKIIKEVEEKTNKVRHSVIFVDPKLFFSQRNDLSSIKNLSPTTSEHGTPQLLSMLILAFPEIQWIFMPGLIVKNSSENEIHKNFHCYSFEGLNDFINKVIIFNNFELIALFDPCNLRNQIKCNIYNVEKGLPERKLCAAAIDEEISYAVMNAYTAYRFGYRAWVIPSLKTMEHVFKIKKNNSGFEVKLLFEDLYLNFPDKQVDYHLSDLKFRDKEFKNLKKIEDRVLVTVGHQLHTSEKNKWKSNLTYLKYTFQGKYKILYKPISGIFDLWKKTGKWKWFKNEPKSEENFCWPPEDFTKLYDKNISHSAPGRLLLIAEKLLDRSARILKDAMTVTDAIHAATLALEAKELLACKTPTKALEAVALQHQAEVEAECRFYGVEYDFDIKSRIKDIKKEVKAISAWFHHSAKKRSQLNAEISILSTLAQKYRNYSQFDEENYCLHETRKLTNSLFVNRKPLWGIVWFFRAYINLLLRSLGRFVFIILLWIFLFGVIYYSVANSRKNTEVKFVDAVIVSAQTFLAFQPPDLDFWVKSTQEFKPPTPVKLIYFIFPAVLGFIHLGVFISHLTLILMRKPGG